MSGAGRSIAEPVIAPTSIIGAAGTNGSAGDSGSCITCGDVAVEVVVVSVDGHDALCVAAQGVAAQGPASAARERIATDLLDGVQVGDRLLAHAQVALVRLDGASASGSRSDEGARGRGTGHDTERLDAT